jgi:hypothetical protein
MIVVHVGSPANPSTNKESQIRYGVVGANRTSPAIGWCKAASQGLFRHIERFAQPTNGTNGPQPRTLVSINKKKKRMSL